MISIVAIGLGLGVCFQHGVPDKEEDYACLSVGR